MSQVGVFSSTDASLRPGAEVVVRTDRGREVGMVMAAVPTTGSAGPPPAGQILRELTERDRERVRNVEQDEIPREMAFCRERIKAHELPMELVYAEHLFGGEKVIFYFIAEGRVDFRQLVKDLAKEYRTRIELRQIGVRDEARLWGGYGHCGRMLCCRGHLKAMDPVSMRMAKNQKATLDPTKISGQCGRLMCCLRFEDEVYRELKRRLPQKGSHVVADRVTGEVVDYDILQQTVRVETESGAVVTVAVAEIREEKVRSVVSQEDEEDSREEGKE
jgi:cell fate regulator YaaT (PSP1 superfamily)